MSLAACGNWQGLDPVPVSLKCAPLPGDLAAEAKKGPQIKGDTAVEVAGRLVTQVHRKNQALDRAVKNYEACRAT